ncbi:glycosyltransferase family 4 protein [Marinobacter sp. DUT-3]|uniref:glycosyltransferase family 4 protein n=1 Tax=Marinobacter sp. DUT-3 TaxID=3412036 RepID=UPI003D172F93
MKVLLLSRYGRLGASSRVRFLQYLPYFQSKGIEFKVKPLLSDAYLKALYTGGSLWREVLKGYISRIMVLLTAWRFDVIIIEKELFPFMPAIAERCLKLARVPYVVDYDDALFHRYDCHTNRLVRLLLGHKIDLVMRHASCVTTGNQYLADRAKKSGARKVEIIPTVVDADRYQSRPLSDTELLTVGWIGTPQTSQYLKPLLKVFASLKQEFPVRFVAVGANPKDFGNTPVEAWPWSEDSEVKSVQQFDIGIMPLVDSPWERGKCGYKLIQYLACGVPVVASSVGVNREIVKEDENGKLVENVEQWHQALSKMLKVGRPRLEEMGQVGREMVVDWYSLQAQAPRLVAVLIGAVKA